MAVGSWLFLNPQLSTLKVCACERNVNLFTISQRAQPKLNNVVVNPQLKTSPFVVLQHVYGSFFQIIYQKILLGNTNSLYLP